MYYEIGLLALIVLSVMQYIGGFSINKFVDDNAHMFKKLEESDFEFYAKAKYGDAVDIEKLFNARLKQASFIFFDRVVFFPSIIILFVCNFSQVIMSYSSVMFLLILCI